MVYPASGKFAVGKGGGLMAVRQAIEQLRPYKPPISGRKGHVRLDFNENTNGPSPVVLDALKSLDVTELSGYPDYTDVLEKIAQYRKCAIENLVLTGGIDNALELIYNVYVNPEDTVVFAVPTFSMYEFYADRIGAKVVKVPYRNDFSYPFDEVMDAITTTAPSLLIVANPNNPTGTGISLEELEKLCKFISDKSPDTMVVVDEAYAEFNGIDSSFLLNKVRNLLVLRTFSKAFGLAGLRIGFIQGNSSQISVLKKASSPYPVNSLACVAVCAALDDVQYVENYVREVRAQKQRLVNELTQMGMPVVDGQANFILVKFGKINGWIVKRLQERGILIRDRSSDEMLEGYSRVTVSSEREMDRFLTQIKKILAKPAFLFDMDGVLVDVSESYYKAILMCVEKFTRDKASVKDVEQIKRIPGFNNDWKVAYELIKQKGGSPTYEQVVETFQEFYLHNPGLIKNEKWLLDPKILERLSKEYRLGIVTGRPSAEAELALQGKRQFFLSVVTWDDVQNDKPDPAGINLALSELMADNGYYIGDTVNDILAARNAGIIPIGIVKGEGDSLTTDVMCKAGAARILETINEVESVLNE